MASGAIRGITVEIDGNTTKLQQALQGVNKTLSTSQKGLREIEKLLKMDPGNTDLLKQKQEYLAEAIEATKQKLETERLALEQMSAAGGDAKAIEQQRALEREVTATEQKLKDLERQAAQAASVLGSQMQAAGQKMQQIGQSVAGVGQKLTTSLTLPLAAAGAAAVKVTMDFDSAMSQVAAVSGATGAEFDALREKAREMGATTMFSATEAAEAFNYMAMAGWKTEDMLGGIEGILSLAAASGEDLAATSDIVTDALTAFGLSASDSAHFADVLAAASSNANTNVSMMGETFKYAAPLAGALGYDVEDVAVAIGLMANAGIKASNGGTALRNILTNLAKPTKDSATAMEALDISLTDTEGNMKPLMEVMEDLRDRFADLTEEEKAQYAAMIAGKNGMSGLLAIVNAGEADFEKLASAVSSCDGAAADMAATMQDNLAGQVTILKSNLQELGISLGDLLVPKAQALVEKAQAATTALAGMDDKTKNLVVNLGLAAAAAGPVTTAVGKLTQGLGAAIEAGGKLSSWAAGAGISMGVLGAAAVGAGIVIGDMVREAGVLSTIGFDDSIDSIQAAADAVEDWEKKLLDARAAYDQAVSEGQDQFAYLRAINEAETGLEHAREQLDALRGSTEAVAEVMGLLETHEISVAEAAELLGTDAATLRNEMRVEDHEAYAGALQETGDAALEAGDALAELSEEEQAAQEAAEKAAEAYQQLCDDLAAMPGVVAATGLSVGELATLLTDAGMSAEQFASGVASTRDSIVNDFQAISNQSSLTAAEMIENLQNNLAAQQSWSGNMRSLWAESFGDSGMGGTVRAFLSYLAEQGPEYASVVQEFASGGYDALVEAASAWQDAGNQAAQDYADGVAMADYVAQESGQALAEGAAEGIEAGDLAGAGEAAANEAVEAFGGVDGTPSGEELAGEFESGISGKAGDVAQAAEDAATGASEAFDGVDGTPSGEKLAGDFQSGIEGKAGDVAGAAKDTAEGAAEAAKIDTTDVGEYLMAGVESGIVNGRSGVINAAKEAVQAAVQAAKDAAQIASPSKVMRDEVGKFLTEGIAVGILDSEALGALEASADELTAALAGWFRVDLESAESEITSQIADWAKAWQEELSETIRIGEHAADMISWQGGDPEDQIREYRKLQDALHKQAEGYRAAGVAETSKYIQDLESKWWGYEQKIVSIQEQAEQERLQAEQEAAEARQKAAEAFVELWGDALDDFADDYQAAFNDIMQQQEAMQAKLAGYGELYHLTGTTVSLSNLDSQTKAIERYGRALENLKTRGADSGIMSEILAMDVKDATLYGEKLLSLTNREWENYMDAYQRKQEAAAQVAERWYAGELDALNGEYLDKLPETLAGLPEDLGSLGAEGAALFAETFAEKISDYAPLIREALTGAIGSWMLPGDLTGAGSAGAAAMAAYGTSRTGAEESREIVQAVNTEQEALTGLLQSIADNTATVGTLVITLDGRILGEAGLPYIIAAAKAAGTPIVNV